jgi:aspartyl-tRNA(Asn)/glutamyl-tRNA(Gln) amidotransferase subunit B
MMRSTNFLRRRPLSLARRTFASLDWKVHSETGIISHGNKPLFQTIIGMEIHAQLDIPTKLFSSAPKVDTLSTPPNSTAVWPLDVAVPGVLPRTSLEAVQAALLTAAACNCQIPNSSRFERKHYAYADLPLGYQVTQQRWPIATNGVLKCRRRTMDRKKKQQESFLSVGIDRIQLEQDTGKTIAVTRRETAPDGTEFVLTESLVDFNRAGCALVEIVFNPDIRSANDAASVLSTLRDTMRYIGTCDGRMEEGSLRCDLNISIAPINFDENDENRDLDNPFQDSLPPGTGNRVEVKNLNSIKQVFSAAQYEATRQAEAHANGVPTQRETRTFDVKTGKTVTIRSKEGAVDYRFMPEPDLPPIVLNKEVLNGMSLEMFLQQNLPELPEQATIRLMEEYGLSEDVALVITGDPPSVKMYEEAVSTCRQELGDEMPKKLNETVANWLCNDLFALVKEGVAEDEYSVEYSRVSGVQLGQLVAQMVEGSISTTMAKKILNLMYHEELAKSPRLIAEERNLQVITDLDTLEEICKQVIEQHDSQLEQYKKGGKHVRKMKKFFLGKAMAHSRGNAQPELLSDALDEMLEKLAPNVTE